MTDTSAGSKFISDIMQKIETLKGDIENAEQDIKSLRELALKECPFNTHDIVIANDYAHTGKRMMIIDFIFVEESGCCGPMMSGGIHPDCAGWVAKGLVMRKNNTVGSLSAWRFEPIDKSKQRPGINEKARPAKAQGQGTQDG